MKNFWKTLGIALFSLFVLVGTCFACFDNDPGSNTGNPSTTISSEHGATVDVWLPGVSLPDDVVIKPPITWPTPELPDNDPRKDYQYALRLKAAFPLTLNVSFSGFLDSDGNEVTEPITRMCLLYFSTAGKWTILKDIKNPQYTVIGDAENRRALFGRHTIASPLGYNAGESLPVLLYFRTASYESFSLSSVLASDYSKPINNAVICIVPTGNAVPF